MKLDAGDYLECAKQRVPQAAALLDPADGDDNPAGVDRYAAVVYLAGVACECVLRAHIVRFNDTFDSRHDLQALFADSRLEVRLKEHLTNQGVAPEDVDRRVGDLTGAVLELKRLWQNDSRYASDTRLVRHYVERGILKRKSNRGGKHQILRPFAVRAVKAARLVVFEGVEVWTA